MPRKAAKLSTDIFGAVSAPTRVQALKLLNTRGALSYSELMEMVNLEPTKDAGKFVYHLKNLLSSNLIDMDTKKKKYRITELGSVVVNFARTLEEYALKKQGKLFVRTSKYVIEEFDRGKIAEALISEAAVPADLAERISTEAEERLLKLPTRYLTAPLIREFVNAILIEKGYEDYRHKLTRLGMPVHDVTGMFLKAIEEAQDANYVSQAAGNQVLTEFMLLNAVPREIADAHLSGRIHICNSNQWVLNPHTVYHDLRTFFKHGLSSGSSAMPVAVSQPKSFTGALFITLDVVHTFQKEISGQQTFDYFNVFLAPFLDGISEEKASELLKIFLIELSMVTSYASQPVTLALEFGVPEHIRQSPAITIGGKTDGTYGDFEEKTQKVLKLLIDSAVELSEARPLFSPSLMLKLRADTLRAGNEQILEKAHTLASRFGLLHIANLTKDRQEICSYNGIGERLENDWTEDWEVDTLRVGFLDNVSLNLPRAAYEAKGNDEKFREEFSSYFNLAKRALDIKQKTIEENLARGLLRHLGRTVDGESYFRVANSARVVSFVGLNEAVRFHVGRQIHEDQTALSFALQTTKDLGGLAETVSESARARIALSQVSEPDGSQRLAQHDLEEFGKSVVLSRPEREGLLPYSSSNILPFDANLSWQERLRIEEKFHPITRGGHISTVPLDREYRPESLGARTKDICKNFDVGLFAYTYSLTVCGQCGATFTEFIHRCTKCDSALVTHYRNRAGVYAPVMEQRGAKRSRRF